ncbi:HNH endonuclease [Ornithinimicrobium cavernae]|uniref:HNH endonuclease n=1 Tax=Ornithinimicrobium cavernae TaxID=2666047 RepID=UPI001F19AC76|nr:DUF222 domain-containing protein [Ornithinimicrobium cavernae]
MTAQAESVGLAVDAAQAVTGRDASSAVSGGALSSGEVASWVERMAVGGDLGPLAEVGPAELCEVLHRLEVLKNAAAAAQARVTVLAAARLQEQAVADGASEETAAKGVGAQLALARRESPHAGSRHVGFARAVVGEMPATHAALTAGLIGEWTATQVVKETACLSVEHRARVDAHLAGLFGTASHRWLVAAAKAKAYELDPYSVANRGRKAVKDRRVTVRPAPDVMAIVSGYLPVAQGVACYKALDEAAKALRAAGDERSLDQLRADVFTQRLTGQDTAEDVTIEVGLVMTDKALVGAEETPARLEGYGPLPAPLARDLLREAREAVVWLRRLYADPVTGVLTVQDGRRRRFTGALRRFLVARDQVCRTPRCEAPVRHADHVVPWARGGRTTAGEGQGLCEACNYAKEATGWSHEVVDLPDGSHTVRITTPTGHIYYSQPPPVLPTLGPGPGAATDRALRDAVRRSVHGSRATTTGAVAEGAEPLGAGVPEVTRAGSREDAAPPPSTGPGPGPGSRPARTSAMSCRRRRHGEVTIRLRTPVGPPGRPAQPPWIPAPQTSPAADRSLAWRFPSR